MLSERIEPGEFASARGLGSAYGTALAGIVESTGRNRAVEAGVNPETIAAVESADSRGLPLAEVAAVLALGDGWPDRGTVECELRDDLLVGMSHAVLDAAALARAAGPGLDAGSVRAGIEGDRDLTLAEYARLQFVIASEVP